MGLKPQSIVQAAYADLARRGRNMERVPRKEDGRAPLTDAMETYAFHRKHVRRATSARDLIARALANPEVVVPKMKPATPGVPAATEKPVSPKRNTVIIYSDLPLLEQALALADETEKWVRNRE